MNAQLDTIRWRAVDAIASALLLLVVDRSEVERPQESDRLADPGLLRLRSHNEDVVAFTDVACERFETAREEPVVVGNQNFHREAGSQAIELNSNS